MAESLWSEAHASKSTREEEKERHEAEASKVKDKSKEKYWAKSIQELDLSDCQRCTHSYRLLTDDVSLLYDYFFYFLIIFVVIFW